MHKNHQQFIQAIHDRKKILLTFFSKEDNSQLTRTCAPMDYGPSRRAKDKSDRYHFWDFESDTRVHTLSLLANQILEIKILEETFLPAEFITWNLNSSPWFYKRDWGNFS